MKIQITFPDWLRPEAAAAAINLSPDQFRAKVAGIEPWRPEELDQVVGFLDKIAFTAAPFFFDQVACLAEDMAA